MRTSIQWVKPGVVASLLIATLLLSGAPLPGAAAVAQTDSDSQLYTPKAQYQVPLRFEANQGQADPRVKFLSRGNGYTLFLTDLERAYSSTGAVLVRENVDAVGAITHSAFEIELLPEVDTIFLSGYIPEPVITGLDDLPGKTNYFIGSNWIGSNWNTNIPYYAKVWYQDVYPGYDVFYHGSQGGFVQEFVLPPGFSGGILLGFRNLDDINLDSQGNLVLRIGSDELVLNAPVSYQDTGSGREETSGGYAVISRSGSGTKVGAVVEVSGGDGIDPERPLAISISAVLGGVGTGVGNDIAVDPSGNVYVVGDARLIDYSVSDEAVSIRNEIFVTKLDPKSGSPFYTTYLGVSGVDSGQGIAVDNDGKVYITGRADSADFPITNEICNYPCKIQPLGTLGTIDQPRYGGGTSDVLVAKLSPAGDSLLYSQYLGVGGAEEGRDIAVDAAGFAYVTGN